MMVGPPSPFVPGWEIPPSAAVYSTVAGTLAAILLVVVPISLQWTTDPNDKGDAKAMSARASLMRLFVGAFVFLMLSAVFWGVLAGEPSRQALKEAPLADQRAAFTQEAVIATAAIILVGLGALAVLLGLSHVFAHYINDLVNAMTVAVVGSFAFVLYEVAFFGVQALCLYHGWGTDWMSYYLLLAPLLAGLAHHKVARIARGKALGPLRRWRLWLAVLSGAAGTLAFLLSPGGQLDRGVQEIRLMDGASVYLVIASGVLFYAFGLTAGWTVPSIFKEATH